MRTWRSLDTRTSVTLAMADAAESRPFRRSGQMAFCSTCMCIGINVGNPAAGRCSCAMLIPIVRCRTASPNARSFVPQCRGADLIVQEQVANFPLQLL